VPGSDGETGIDEGTGANASAADATDEAASTVAETDGAGTAAAGGVDTAGPGETETAETAGEVDGDAESAAAETSEETDAVEGNNGVASGEGDETDGSDETGETGESTGTLRGIARDVVGDGTGEVRLTDDSFRTVASGGADEAFDLLKDADEVPYAVFVDGEVTQRLLDVAAQRGTEHVVGRSLAEFVKRPVSVRIRTAEQLLGPRPANE
jgi:hypothetical protein